MSKKVSFKAMKKIKKPIRVKFIDKDGKLISFKAKKTIKKPTRVKFKIKENKKK